MSDSVLVKKVQEMLNEEKWTRATLSNYTNHNFKELDALIREVMQAQEAEELKAVCDEHLGHTKNSIIALYISGILSLAKQLVDDSSIIQLIEIFQDNKKWNIVEFLCTRILDYGENKLALRVLADCYKNDNKESEIYDIWERLIKVDYEEADIVKLLAEKKEKDGETDAAVEFYKKALHRYISKKLFTNIKEIWNKLIDFCPDDIEFFFHVQKKIAKQISTEKAGQLLQDLYKHFKDAKDYNTGLEIAKMIMEYDEKDPWARREITDCYKGKYAGHSHLDEYVRMSNLASGPRNIHEAMADFEKHIAFDAGNFISHRTWGIGRIQKVQGDEIIIDFAKSRDHKMSLKMAVNALTTLSKDHIWTLKAVWKKEKLHDKVKTDVKWALITIIRSFDNRSDMKRIKAELVPSVLTVSEWTSFSTQARDILKTDPLFGNAQDNIDTYLVRERPLTIEEKIFNQFKAEKNFFSRVSFMRTFLDHAETDSEYFGEMFGFFAAYIKSISTVNEFTVSSYLFVKELAARYPFLKESLTSSFAEIFEEIENIDQMYESIKDSDLRKAFLLDIKNFAEDWADIYIRLFPTTLNASLLVVLADGGYTDKLKDMALRIVENYRDNREAFIWLVRYSTEESWFKALKLPYEKILIVLIHILDISFKEIENHRDTTLNRKLNKQIQTMLFKDNVLENYIGDAEEDTITRIYTLLFGVKDLDPGIKMLLRKKVTEKYPTFKFYGDEERTVVSRGLMVTVEKFEEKNRQLANILEVEVPTNSKEIAYALSLGDLRENAEYKAAKEKQDILNSTVAKLKNEIERAQIFDKNAVNTSRVSFGTHVFLTNVLANKEEEYTILGPWESDPAKNIISYLSPFGNELLNKKVGEKLKFIINERSYEYTINKIINAKL